MRGGGGIMKGLTHNFKDILQYIVRALHGLLLYATQQNRSQQVNQSQLLQSNAWLHFWAGACQAMAKGLQHILLRRFHVKAWTLLRYVCNITFSLHLPLLPHFQHCLPTPDMFLVESSNFQLYLYWASSIKPGVLGRLDVRRRRWWYSWAQKCFLVSCIHLVMKLDTLKWFGCLFVGMKHILQFSPGHVGKCKCIEASVVTIFI